MSYELKMQIKEVNATRILNPTSIDLGEYVINPYKGCQFSCLYCYVRYNKVVKAEPRQWGDYVDARINAPEQLEKELSLKKPRRVLLGSTTECFQPIEAKYRLTGRILEILNKNGVYYSILTRSPLIIDYISLLSKGLCEGVYFTINNFDDKLKFLLEPKSPPFQARTNAINKLLEHKIPVIPYLSPVLPRISDTKSIFSVFGGAGRIDFEGLNFNLGNIKEVIGAIGSLYPDRKELYENMATDINIYNAVWDITRKDIMRQAINAKKNHDIYIHQLHSYFNNKYREPLKANL